MKWATGSPGAFGAFAKLERVDVDEVVCGLERSGMELPRCLCRCS